LRVQARNGYVRLSGTVATVNDWMKADETARSAAGGAEVQNNLSVMIR
jgi:osmotically-inducible protein OsmY